jgi:hypothetical protein
MTRARRDGVAPEDGATQTGRDAGEGFDSPAAAPSKEDMIARNLTLLFRRFQNEPLPERFTELLGQLAEEAAEPPDDGEGGAA